MSFSTRSTEYPDDIFAETRMSFGDHIEELRDRLIKAILGLAIVMIGGVILDFIGKSTDLDWLGVGRPMLDVIVAPAEAQVRAFYARRNEKALGKLMAAQSDPAELARVLEKWKSYDHDNSQLTAEEVAVLRGAPEEMPVILPTKVFEEAFGLKPKDPTQTDIKVQLKVYPAYINYLSNRGETLLENRQYMRTQNPQEAFVVYFKVSLLCGVVLGSPWIFYQVWAFVAAGLYPHERAYVYRFLGPSVGLFILGALICQFIVLPGAVKALLAFNTWVELDPDLRLNEWLGFALILPVVFGISFQTPLVMFFLNRIGTFSAEDYLAKWRVAVMVLAVFAAVITPTPDVVTMSYLFVPMFALYMVGAAICYYMPPEYESAWKDEGEQVAV